jgi:dTDP-4-dehydrorhamnose reductase
LGEVDYAPHLTIRTSIIGHELNSNVSLIDWFLSQEGETKGFSKAIFSGLPTCYIARILAENILPNHELTGLHQLSVDPIDKYTLLNKVATVYSKKIVINECISLEIDRSLNSNKLQGISSFKVPSWDLLLNTMHLDYLKYYK